MRKILVVDDDEHVRDYLLAHLAGWGYGVESCTSGASAIEMALEDTPDLLILDINMPGMTGYEVISKLRLENATQNVPIIALSANSASGDRDEAYELGCNAYLAKPIIDVDTLRAAIERLLP